MKCQTCEGEVPQKFQYAIAMNCCPLCGQQIMEPELQKILATLREAMAEVVAQDFQAEAFDWLRSNFNLISTESEDYQKLQQELLQVKKELQETQEKYLKPVPKSGKVLQQQQTVDPNQIGVDEEGHQVQLQGESIQDPERTQVFLNRANVNKMTSKNDHFKKIVNQIKKKGAPAAMGEEGGGGTITPEMIAAASPEEVEQMEAMLSGGIPGIGSAIDSDYDDEELPPIAQSLMAMGNNGGKPQSGDYNPRDVAKLQELQAKSARASKALDRGGSVGLIRR